MKEAIGEIIRDAIRKQGITQEEFASEMGMTHRNLANLFNKKHIPIDQLMRASKLLKQDFIKDYTEWLYENETSLIPFKASENLSSIINTKKIDQISFSLTVKGSMESVQNEISSFLKSVQQEAESRGLTIA